MTGALAVVTFALFVLTMMVGSFYVSAWDVITSAFHLRDEPSVDFIVRDLRLPTATAALAVGFALGVSGMLFQRLLGNPLASPDFVGISSGASLFAVSSIILFGAGSSMISASALAGALLTALLIYVLAWRDGISGYRFILIGIGISEFMPGDHRLHRRARRAVRGAAGDDLAGRHGRPVRLDRAAYAARRAGGARAGRAAVATTAARPRAG